MKAVSPTYVPSPNSRKMGTLLVPTPRGSGKLVGDTAFIQPHPYLPEVPPLGDLGFTGVAVAVHGTHVLLDILEEFFNKECMIGCTTVEINLPPLEG